MGMVLDMKGVLREIAKNREQLPFNARRDTIVDTIHSEHSPSEYDSQLNLQLQKALHSLKELICNFFLKDENSAQSSVNSKPTERQPESTKCVIHVWEAPKNPKLFEFKKDIPQPPVVPTQSELTREMKEGMARYKAAPTPSPQKTQVIKVFVSAKERVKITVSHTTTIEEIIKTALQLYEMQCNDAKKRPAISLNSKAYVLRFSEDDGTPDDDMPALVRTQEVGQFMGMTNFVLCRDTTFKLDDGRPPAQLFKVYLPKEEGFVSVAFKPDMTLEMLLTIVCKKRAIDSKEDYHFELFDDKTPLPLNVKLGTLNVMKIRMVSGRHKRVHSIGKMALAHFKKSGSLSSIHEGSQKRDSNRDSRRESRDVGDASKPITKRVGPVFFFTIQTASKYTVYPVTKIKQLGSKQERLMGIDDKRITNQFPENKQKGNEKTKRPERPIADLQRVWINPMKENQFVMEFKDKTYKYESKSTEEIVAKLNFLLQMQDEERQRHERTS